jgi:hypothetical protein
VPSFEERTFKERTFEACTLEQQAPGDAKQLKACSLPQGAALLG